jgi:DNA polymerase III subunit epsilon
VSFVVKWISVRKDGTVHNTLITLIQGIFNYGNVSISCSKKVMLLFFDTETTGLPKNWKAPVTDLNNWPRLVQLAFLLYDREGNRVSERNYIIKPDGFKIPADVVRIHGITHERATSEGRDLRSVLEEFREFADRSKYLVAHNINFDEKIVGAELLRNKMANCILAKNKICTMQSTTDFCKIKDHMAINGLPCPSFISNFSGRHSMRHMMQWSISMQLPDVSGSSESLGR